MTMLSFLRNLCEGEFLTHCIMSFITTCPLASGEVASFFPLHKDFAKSSGGNIIWLAEVCCLGGDFIYPHVNDLLQLNFIYHL